MTATASNASSLESHDGLLLGAGWRARTGSHQRNAGMISRPYVSSIEKCRSGSTIER